MIKIHYKEKGFLIASKPYGVASQEGANENMVALLENQLGTKIYPVHRLDTTTTGLIIYATDQKMAGMLSSLISEGGLTKEYLALCHGTLENAGEMTDFLYHDRLKNKSFAVKSKRAGAKVACLEFQTLCSVNFRENTPLSLVKIKLLTGRTHQIRVQFSSRGNALYGDGKYGAHDNDKIALHSYHISLIHPITKEQIDIYELPQGNVWDKIQNELSTLI